MGGTRRQRFARASESAVAVKAGTKRSEKVPPSGGSLVSRTRRAGRCRGGGGRRGGSIGSLMVAV